MAETVSVSSASRRRASLNEQPRVEAERCSERQYLPANGQQRAKRKSISLCDTAVQKAPDTGRRGTPRAKREECAPELQIRLVVGGLAVNAQALERYSYQSSAQRKDLPLFNQLTSLVAKKANRCKS
ncbi:hypothetical protein EYF80_036909 [Liparis tanakae]|uniref:Uncharacterized protein n=1 Tax=Liparis tanakae TaxID=230148 RepID=A0A4Z2GHG9_9TELE|nr:hypothetical protein EYF80_036909 [Liparis tanakae]